MMRNFVSCLLLGSFGAATVADQGYKMIKEDTQPRTLVVLDNWATVETHSIFFDHLSEKLDHELRFAMMDTEWLDYKELESWRVDNVIFMAPSIKESAIGKKIQLEETLDFFKANSDSKPHNIMMFLAQDTRRWMRKLALEFGVDLESVNTGVRDDTSEFLDKVMSDRIFNPLLDLHTPIFSQGNVFFNGIGSTLDTENPYVFPILRASDSSYSKNAKPDPDATENEEATEISGQEITLVSGYQSLHNNRAVVSGSTQMCSDEVLASSPDNIKFCFELTDWAMQESGVLRSKGIKHWETGSAVAGLKNPENYKLEEHVHFEVALELKMAGQWQPFKADDLDLQFIMLEPYYSVPLEKDIKNEGTYFYNFRVPQRLGVFRFVVDYKHHGMTYLDEQEEVSVIQWRHDDFERFLPRAYPFYLTAFVLMGAFFILIMSMLFSANQESHKTTKSQKDHEISNEIKSDVMHQKQKKEKLTNQKAKGKKD